jgi:hypothetical protein
MRVAGGSAPATLIPVKGKVTYKGQPVAKGRVKFAPDGYGRPAYGQLHSDGSFVLTTEKEGDGVVAGEHRVIVTDTGIKSPKDALAAKWANRAASGLTANVDAEHNEFTFDLK